MKLTTLLTFGLMLVPVVLCVAVAKTCTQMQPVTLDAPVASPLQADHPPIVQGALPPPPIDPLTGRMLEVLPAADPPVLSVEKELQPIEAQLEPILRRALEKEAETEQAQADARQHPGCPVPPWPDHARTDLAFERKLGHFRQCVRENRHDEAIQDLNWFVENAAMASVGMLRVLKNDLTVLMAHGGK